jgi:hypothetical protein
VAASDAQMCAGLPVACEGDDLSKPPRLVARGDDNCGQYREIDCGACSEDQRTYVTLPQPEKLIPDGQAQIVVNQALVRVRDGITRAQVNELARDFHARVIGQLPAAHEYQLELPTATVEELLQSLARLEADAGRVQSASPNMQLPPSEAQALLPECLAPNAVSHVAGRAQCAYASTEFHQALTVFEHFRPRMKLSPVGIGMLDTGIDLGPGRCPQFRDVRILNGGAASPPQGPRFWHGAAVMSVIASHDPGGMEGIASRFLGDRLRVQMSQVYTDLATAKLRIGWLLRSNAVVNVSANFDFGALSWWHPRQRWADQFREWWRLTMLQNPGTLLVVAAPNDGAELQRNTLAVPVALDVPNAITVGGSTSCQALPVRRPRAGPDGGSAFGPLVEIYAPSSAIRVVVAPACGLTEWPGNSLAAPQVASVAAIVKSLRPDLTGAALKRVLLLHACGNENDDALLCMGNVIGAAMLRLNDPVIDNVLDADGGDDFDGLGSVLPRICDKGMVSQIGNQGWLRHEVDQIPLLPSNVFSLYGDGPQGSQGIDTDSRLNLGTQDMDRNRGSAVFRGAGNSMTISGTLDVLACRINERALLRNDSGISGVYPWIVTVMGQFRGTCWIFDAYKKQPCRGAFLAPIMMQDSLQEQINYVEVSCQAGVPEFARP